MLWSFQGRGLESPVLVAEPWLQRTQFENDDGTQWGAAEGQDGQTCVLQDHSDICVLDAEKQI